MGLRFSEGGPEFPDDLIDDLLEGRVTFLCGAGVSAPQLPGFHDLVKRIYRKVRAKIEPSEKGAIKAGRYEEALGALERRLSDSRQLYSATSELLSISRIRSPDLTNHKILLSLSRKLDNRIGLVTTNFDALFEHAVVEDGSHVHPRLLSLAGQSIPGPGASDFAGIIHLHGRLLDERLGLDATPLVLTSAQYGEAYMRSGWASRFLFDLARCRTIVLVGYSAGDAPVRYFLNVLESDRQRFEDLRPIYALEAVEHDASQANARWAAVAVRALPYRRNSQAPGGPHANLWRDLGDLAELMRQPRAWRRRSAAAIVASAFDASDADALARVEWLFRGKGDLWDIVIRKMDDPRWLAYLSDSRIVAEADVAWLLAAWCLQRWSDGIALKTALEWYERLGDKFIRALYERLRDPRLALSSQPAIAKAWRLLSQARVPLRNRLVDAYSRAQRLRDGDFTDSDLHDAVALLTPVARLRWAGRIPPGAIACGEPVRLADLIRIDLEAGLDVELDEVAKALRDARSHARRIAEIATGQLCRTIAFARDADLITPEWDRLDYSVPVVVSHAQNAYHDGVVHLVTLVADLFPMIAESDPDYARVLAQTWRRLPTRIGARLWCQTLLEERVFSTEQVVDELLMLPVADFWAIRPEIVIVMSRRVVHAQSDKIASLERRIIDEAGAAYPDVIPAVDAERELLEFARDQAAWVRLKTLDAKGVLGQGAQRALKRIVERNPSLDRSLQEQDFFSSYSFGVRAIQPDVEPLLRAAPDDRLDVAIRLTKEWLPERQFSWSQYCAVSPDDALRVLQNGPLDDSTAGLWAPYLARLTFRMIGQPSDSAVQEQVPISAIFSHLERAETAFLRSVLTQIVDALGCVTPESMSTWRLWWDRLWAIAAQLMNEGDHEIHESEARFPERALQSPAGRLTEQLLGVMPGGNGARVRDEDRGRLRNLISLDAASGWFARAVLTLHAEKVVCIDSRMALQQLKPWLQDKGPQGQALRSVLVTSSELGKSAMRAFKGCVLRGAAEYHGPFESAPGVAGRVLWTFSQSLLSGSSKKPVIDAEDIRRVLVRVHPSVLEGAVQYLRLVLDRQPDKARAWEILIRPVLRDVWPTERRFRSASLTRELIALSVTAEKAFPVALNDIAHLLVPVERGGHGLYMMIQSDIPENYPLQVLDLLWAVLYSSSGGDGTPSLELGKILDRISAAAPEVEGDRRFQWLEQRTLRLA
ncbi:SIR2 family protein [Paraburkholderia oxyphila]|uniref:SIR2 family protein n=1 Tax=Paraburkholderia oxyphila TaxID=614212 RepID=UPI0004899E7A|nr:SIR2 family protein [Paraburkholderia oxyphila]